MYTSCINKGNLTTYLPTYLPTYLTYLLYERNKVSKRWLGILCVLFILLQVKAVSNNSFVTSSVDSGLSLWKDDGQRLTTFKGN